jgi:hypothetical protein
MRGSKALLTGLGAALLALVAAPALGQQEVADPPDPWLHAATLAPFPAEVAGFRRGRVIEYSADGRDASVGYHLARGDDRLTVTLYVYPTIAGRTCGQVFDAAKADVAQYQGAWLIGERREAPPGGGDSGGNGAWFARYSIPAGAMAASIPEVWSDVYLYCPAGGEWLVKYRATWDADVDFSEDIARLIHAIEWPDGLDG